MKKFLRKVVKNWVEYEIEWQKVFIITEDLVSVTQDATKWVSPYSASYWYTNIDINANAWIKWVEWAIYSFVVKTEMVVASAYRNVRVRIWNWAYIPMKNRANSILAWSSYMTKGRTQFFVYKTVYETWWALHLNTDTSYSAMSVSEWTTWTATSSRVMRADYLKQIIEWLAIAKTKNGWQTISNTDTSSTTPLSLSAKSTSWSCFLAFNWKDWFLASYWVSSNKKPIFYDWESKQLAIISWASFGSSWSWVADKSPSQNAVYNKISAMDTEINWKIDNPDNWNVWDVLTKTADWEEWLPPTWWGWNLDIDEVNWLIDIKLKDSESIFKSKSWLYKTLNNIDDSDELWLESWDIWEDIVADDISISKITHCYAVMCYVASSEYAMSKILEDSSATKEISECWNSISIISESKLASDLYLLSVNWITYLYTYQTAQDAFFTSPERKLEIVQSEADIIVNNNELFTLLNNEETVKSVIRWNVNLMKIIASDTTKLNIIIDDMDYVNTILWNNNILSQVSDNNFFSLFLENQDILNKVISSTNWKNRVNSYAPDDLLEPILYWTWLSWYTHFADIVNWSDLNVLLDSDNAMSIVLNNTSMKSYLSETKTFDYTGADQTYTIKYWWNYKLECWWAWAKKSAWWYCSWVIHLDRWSVISVMVWARWWNWSWTTYWFWWAWYWWSYGNNNWWWLTWFFLWSWTIQAYDSSRALVIWGWAWGCEYYAWWAGWWTTWWDWSWYDWTKWKWWTQTGHWSWTQWAAQFNWWNWQYWTWCWWWWGWWWWWGSYYWYTYEDDTYWAWWGSWYVKSSATNRVLTTWWWSAAWNNWKAVLTWVW